MAAYVAESVDITDLVSLFTDNWDVKTNSEIPVPLFTESDQSRGDPSEIGATVFAFVNVMISELTEEQVGYAYQYVRRRLPVTLDIWTRRETAANGGTGRQHMHDVKQELRRIIYANKHSLTDWEIIRYIGFEEVFEDSVGVRFHGRIRLMLEDDGVRIEAEEVVEDTFDRANAATLGANWTAAVGTWGIISNLADLQSATANAHARYTGTALKANVRLEVQVITSAGMDAGMIFRWQDSSNYWAVRLVESGGVRFVRLFENVATVFTQVMEYRASSDAFDWTAGNTVQLTVNLQGALITIEVDGAEIFRREDTFLQAETDHGLYSNSDQLTRWNNFRVLEAGGTC
jgi:hypothetical protein